MTSSLWQKSEEELKSLLMKVKEESEKAGLKLNIQKMKIMASGPITLWQIDGKQWKQWQTLFSWALKSLQMVTTAMKLKDAYSLGKKKYYDKPRQHIKKQKHYFVDKGPSNQSYGFSSSHVWELDQKESWAPKNSYFWTVVLEKALESPLNCKEIKAINLKGNQSWIFFGKTDAEAKAPTLWLPDEMSWLTGKDPDAGKHWGRVKGETEDDSRVASTTQWTWVWANSRRLWKTGKPGVLQSGVLQPFAGSQRVGHDWATWQQQYNYDFFTGRK